MNTSVKLHQSSRAADWNQRNNPVPSLFQRWKRKSRTHNYQSSGMGIDFVLEASPENPKEFYMTAYKSGVKRMDCIRIQEASTVQAYRVLEIDYYSEPADMWMARLSPVKALL